MDQTLIQFVNVIESIDWFNLSHLRSCFEILRTKIEHHEDSIPNDIDDDWFSLPQNIPLSFKFRLFRDLLKKIQKFIEELEIEILNDSQDPNDDSLDVTDYNPEDYFKISFACCISAGNQYPDSLESYTWYNNATYNVL